MFSFKTYSSSAGDTQSSKSPAGMCQMINTRRVLFYGIFVLSAVFLTLQFNSTSNQHSSVSDMFHIPDGEPVLMTLMETIRVAIADMLL